MKQINLLSKDGKNIEVWAEIVDRKLWFKIDDKVHSYELSDLQEGSFRKSSIKTKSADKIVSNMPGKITKIFVSEGQQVKKGDALLVMEAMKMAYTMRSDLDAKVESLNVALNDQIPIGQILIKLKPLENI